jgi:hypothetical protein
LGTHSINWDIKYDLGSGDKDRKRLAKVVMVGKGCHGCHGCQSCHIIGFRCSDVPNGSSMVPVIFLLWTIVNSIVVQTFRISDFRFRI